MKNKKFALLGLSVFFVVILSLVAGCSKNAITESNEVSPDLKAAEGIPGDQINWVSWEQEIVKKISALAKQGTESKWIYPDVWGTVGGEKTFGNMVEFPPGAVAEEQYITVDVVCVDENEQCGAGVDFLPSQQFLLDVKVTLSWGYLDYDGDPSDLKIYWRDDDTELWILIPDPEIDLESKTSSFYIDHFTRFGWGF